MRHACPVNAVPDICPLLLRNLDILALVQAGMRLTDDEPSRQAAITTARMSFGHGPVSDDFARQVCSLVSENLAALRWDEELLTWAMFPNLQGDRFREAVDLMKSWRFSGSVRLNHPPDPRAPDAWLVIEAEDVFVDLLMQPLSVLADAIANMHDTWNAAPADGFLFPNLKVGDGTLAVLELFIVASLGIRADPVTQADANFRVGATTWISIRTTANANRKLSADLGFRIVPTGTPFPWDDNADATINESCRTLIAHPGYRGEALYADPYYGHLYHSSILQNNEGIYLPWSQGRPPERFMFIEDIDLPAPNYGWLSVPFRRVARYRVESADELTSMFSTVQDAYAAPSPWKSSYLPLLLRGQTREYLLDRPADARRVLYADPDAREPALLASATRRSTTSQAFHAFATMVQLHLVNLHGPVADDEVTGFIYSFGDFIKLAYAQHYGLATDALDWTTDFLVAAWFALTRLTSAPNGRLTASPVESDAEAVIYCLRPEEGHVVDVQFEGFPAARPNAQHGWVTPASWGLRRNRVASYLLCAIYMPGKVRQELASRLPTQQLLFPNAKQDPLVTVVKRWCDEVPESPISQQLYKDLYEL